MQRYFVALEQMKGNSVALSGEDARHLGTVMRAKPGDLFVAFDGQGRDVLAKIVSVERDLIQAEIVQDLASAAEMAWRVTVAQSLPKGDKLETVIQKGTEAGAFDFQPFHSRRTVVQYDERKEAKRTERWRKIAKEAAEQSHRSRVPEVRNVIDWKKLLSGFNAYDLVLLCYEEEGRTGAGMRSTLANFRRRLEATAAQGQPHVLILVGPEGGFTPEEAEAATVSGAVLTGLGRRILRTETAALYALACIAYESGELGEDTNA